MARGNWRVLAQMAWANTLLAFDFDGTLAPIVDSPGEARMKASTRKLLAELANVYPCVVIAGRGREDCVRRLRGVDVFRVIGDHGIEAGWGGDGGGRSRVDQWAAILRHALRSHAGVFVEVKEFSIAVHHRRAVMKERARDEILRACRHLHEARLLVGNQVVNVVPLGAPGKGIALETQRERLGCERAFYIGDDETDEDVFALASTGRVLAVRVGRSRSTRAPYFIRRQSEIDAVLSTLLQLRRRDLDASSS